MSSQRLLMFNWAQLREGINRVCYNVNAGALRDRLWELRRVWLKFAIEKRFDNYHIPCGHWNLDCYKNVCSLILKKNQKKIGNTFIVCGDTCTNKIYVHLMNDVNPIHKIKSWGGSLNIMQSCWQT